MTLYIRLRNTTSGERPGLKVSIQESLGYRQHVEPLKLDEVSKGLSVDREKEEQGWRPVHCNVKRWVAGR